MLRPPSARALPGALLGALPIALPGALAPALARALPVAAAVVLLAGCGLPLPDGVRSGGGVAAEQRLPEPISVLPPGPQPDATPLQVVEGFLAAQGSSRGDHAIARSFLAEQQRTAWDDDAQARVYDPGGTTLRPGGQDDDTAVVVQRAVIVGAVDPDGAARVVQTSDGRRIDLQYRLRRDAGRQWRIAEAPQGLTLTPADRARTFAAHDVHFLAPDVPGRGARHLVADRVLLPADGEPAQQLVERLLAGPSSGLAGSVQTAVPEGTRLLQPVTVAADGEVVVDLSAAVWDLAPDGRQDVSAQLVWTLREVPGFTRLRLLVEGQPLRVSDSEQPQDSAAWPAYDPDAPDDAPPGYVVRDGALRQLRGQDGRPRDEPPRDLRGVADAAVDPRTGELAVLVGPPRARRLLTGPLPGPLTQRQGLEALPLPGPVASPSWGSGKHGLWLLRTGADPGLVVVPPAAGADAPSGQPVAYDVDADLPSLGDAPLLRVARDGVRVALVARQQLFVGRLEPGPDGRPARLTALRRLRTEVLDVAWETGTSLAVLVRDDDAPRLPLLRLSVDGTSAQETGLLGAGEGTPVALGAFGDQPLLVETTLDGTSTTYQEDGGRGFQVARGGDGARRPSYPR